ncbi:MAG TPA: C39 family peptidase [Terriglobia bacterium]|nr:C39 family peptidase [Terriglobia bacterium]
MMRRFRALRLLLVGLALAGVGVAAEPNRLWLDVPFVRQSKNGCGPASIAMVIQYWRLQSASRETAAGRLPGYDGDPVTIERAVYSKEARGTAGSAMQRYFEQAGFRAFVFKGEWTDLEHHLSQGRPLIVALREPRSNHYVVVSGLDGPQVVLVNDPAQRKLLKVDRASFERAWNGTGNWTLLAVPRQNP